MIGSSVTRSAALAVVLIAAHGCKTERHHDAKHSAERVLDKQVELEDKRIELGNHKQRDIAKASELVETSSDLAEAAAGFAHDKQTRIAGLRAEHQAIATQPMLISTIAQALPLTEAGRTGIDEKLQVFQMRLDETSNLIGRLDRASAEQYAEADDAVIAAMKRLEEARRAAWKALDDAPRNERSS